MSEKEVYPEWCVCQWLLAGDTDRARKWLDRDVRTELPQRVARDALFGAVAYDKPSLLQAALQPLRDHEALLAQLREIFSPDECGELARQTPPATAAGVPERLTAKSRQFVARVHRQCEDRWYAALFAAHPEAIVAALQQDGLHTERACAAIVRHNAATVRRLTGYSGAAYEDLAQAVLPSLVRAVREDRLESAENVHAYFTRACENQFKRRYKKQKRRETIGEDWRREVEAARQASDAAVALDFVLNEVLQQRNDLLYRLLDRAGSNCRDILLGLARGQSAKALAARLEMQPDAVHSRATQCRRRLARLFFEQLEDPCRNMLTRYQLHRRFKRTPEEEAELLAAIQKEFGLPSVRATEDRLSACLEQLYRIVFP